MLIYRAAAFEILLPPGNNLSPLAQDESLVIS
jgi:hypothetical protein